MKRKKKERDGFMRMIKLKLEAILKSHCSMECGILVSIPPHKSLALLEAVLECLFE